MRLASFECETAYKDVWDFVEQLSNAPTKQVDQSRWQGTSIEPGGAIMRKLGEDDDHVRLTLSGCEVKVIVDDSGVESSPKTLEHNRLYKAGSDLRLAIQFSDQARTDFGHESIYWVLVKIQGRDSGNVLTGPALEKWSYVVWRNFIFWVAIGAARLTGISFRWQ